MTQTIQEQIRQRFVWHAGDIVWFNADGKPSAGQQRTLYEDLRRWRSRALDDIKAGRPFRPFVSQCIPQERYTMIQSELQRCTNVEEVKALFERAKEGETRFFAGAVMSGGNQRQSNSAVSKS